jgi:hypothetical protein
MKEEQATLDEIVDMARRLSAREKKQLIERLAPDVEGALGSPGPSSPRRLRSLKGLFRGCTITDQDISEVRREMWCDFPRGDV